MGVTRTIGKNTLGDSDKMRVHLHDYEMSSHNLSYVFRSTVGVGMLVPFMKIVAQKGDIFDIQLINKTMTHPTRGPLFGAFKLQHFVFTAGFRLYNSWLHNNRTGIGMKMSDIKLPLLPTRYIQKPELERVINPSALYSYLGLKGYRKEDEGAIGKQAVPLLIYLDIFKNYFANTQEEKFYSIVSDTDAYIQIIHTNSLLATVKVGNEYQVDLPTNLDSGNYKLTAPDNIENYKEFWNSLILELFNTTSMVSSRYAIKGLVEEANINQKTITIPARSQPINYNRLTGITIAEGKLKNYEESFKPTIESFNLETLDKIRDEILRHAGNTALRINNTGDTEVNQFLTKIANSQESKLGGMLLKTYNSDIFNNWVKTEWIDGENGINKITALKPDADGNITMDALNLQQKVYNMLNRIAVSGGTYRDWLETVYTAGRYLDRPETPVFQGGISQTIEFDEVVATTANQSDKQVLGDLAGRGYARQPKGSGHLHFQVEEPGYVFGVLAITPMVDYSQGNDFDLNILTMDDLHKPALDGIGYQDSMNEQRAWWTAAQTSTGVKSDSTPGKTVAWIDYMTNYNKTFGNFATGENEDFMVLNRNFERSKTNGISNITTYINPQEHIDIFADTELDSQNFWIQTACEITKRGNYSAKQIPNL